MLLSKYSLHSICFTLACATPALAGTVYVDVTLATGANDGSTWANAYQGVAGVTTAIAAAQSGDQIWVVRGTYKPTAGTSRAIAINLRNGIEVYGGFLGGETLLTQRDPVLNETILSGDLNGDDGSSVYTDNSFHVVNGNSTSATAVLDGFTITSGNANTAGSNQDRGGGILCISSSSPTIRHCLFEKNRCTFGGGAGYVNGSSPTFTDCVFEDGVGGTYGGAFDMNTVGTTFDRCIFRRNTAGRAGGVEIFGSSTAKVSDCLFYANTATGTDGGGALYISGNSAQIKNCTIVGNSSTVNATAGIRIASATPVIANCIAWANTGPGGAMGSVNQISTGSNVTYSCVSGGYSGTGNIMSDPQFANVGAEDYRVVLGSPCIDAGNNAAVVAGVVLDLAGVTRFADDPATVDTGSGGPPTVDIGAYELPGPIVATYCFGDGFGTACPCGNQSPPFNEEGCLNSLNIGGKLLASGSARILTDSLVLLGSQMTNSSCLYFQGTTQVNAGNGNAFGDGLRCVGGSIVRLGTKTNSGGASQYPSGADQSVSVRGHVTSAGSMRTYQVWYRNAAAFCAPETYNLTSALAVTWVL